MQARRVSATRPPAPCPAGQSPPPTQAPRIAGTVTWARLDWCHAREQDEPLHDIRPRNRVKTKARGVVSRLAWPPHHRRSADDGERRAAPGVPARAAARATRAMGEPAQSGE